MIRLLVWIAVVYEASVGVSEMLWSATNNRTLAAVAALPSVASLADARITAAVPVGHSYPNYIEGSIDLGLAFAAWYVLLKRG